ncbi:MAG: hypothetical protein ACYC0A_13895, partial [Lutibacter sp.]
MKTKILFIGIIASIVISCNNKQTAFKLNVPSDNLLENRNEDRTITKNKTLNDTSKSLEVNYFIEQLDNTKGLSNSSVNTIFQDS